jgi:hypothetical protein
MPGIPREVIEHHLKIHPDAKPVRQKPRKQSMERQNFICEEVRKLVQAGFIEEVHHPKWLANPVVVPKANRKFWMCIDYTNLNKACLKDPYPLPRIDRCRGSMAGLAGAWIDAMGLSGNAPGIRMPRLGSPLTCRTTSPPSLRVDSDARIAVRIPWSLHRALIPLGSTNSSGAYASPVIPRIRTSSSASDRSVPAPHSILLQSFTPVNMQAILDRCCRGAMQRLRKSPSTIIDVRPHLARTLTRSSTGSSSAGRDGLTFQLLRSRWGPPVGSSRRSLASVMATTQSVRQSSHLALEKALM